MERDNAPAALPAGATPALALHGIGKHFPGVQALDAVSLEIAAGQVHALVGENGAGKSTLVKILAGVLQPDTGTLDIAGRPVRLRNAHAARQHGIAVVYQELSVVPDLSVAENVFLGRWPRWRGTPWVDRRALHAQAAGVLQELGVELPPAASVRGLSVAQQQFVEIARALSLASRILVLDEPSAVLTPPELVRLFAIVRALCDRGLAVIFISHRLEEIFAIADRVTVLRDGQHVATHDVRDVTREQLVTAMVGRPLAEQAAPTRVSHGAGALLQVEGLAADGRFAGVSFGVAPGEVFVLAGLVGSGRSSVLRAIFGAVPVQSGQVRVGNAAGPFRSPRAAMAAGIASLPEDRKRDGLLLERSVRENVTLANLAAVASAGVISTRRERAAAARSCADLHVKAASLEVAVQTLSGGNQQKVLLARWMARPHRVVLLDEPTRGVDVGAKAEIHALVLQLAAEGAAVVVATSELPEAIALGDRIGVMRDGGLAGILDNARRTVTQEEILHLATRAA